MNYQYFLEQVMKLSSLKDVKTAETAIKSVLRVLAAKVTEKEADRLLNLVSVEFDLGSLRDAYRHMAQVSMHDFTTVAAIHLRLNWQETRDVVYRVFHCLKQSSDGAEVMEKITRHLPPDWAEVVDRA